jgi:predicted transcriptional regulator
MTLIELKKSIHERVDNLNDQDYLERLNAMLYQKDEVIEISDKHLASVEQGMQDMKNGDFLTIEQLEKRYEKWLKD